jgi:hypothetical protein
MTKYFIFIFLIFIVSCKTNTDTTEKKQYFKEEKEEVETTKLHFNSTVLTTSETDSTRLDHKERLGKNIVLEYIHEWNIKNVSDGDYFYELYFELIDYNKLATSKTYNINSSEIKFFAKAVFPDLSSTHLLELKEGAILFTELKDSLVEIKITSPIIAVYFDKERNGADTIRFDSKKLVFIPSYVNTKIRPEK